VNLVASGTITNTAYNIKADGVTPVVGPDVFTNLGRGGPPPTPAAVVPTLSYPMLGLLALALVAAALVMMRR